MENKVEVFLDRIYGHERFYPANSTAELMCNLLKQKSFTRAQLQLIKQAECPVIVKQKEYELD